MIPLKNMILNKFNLPAWKLHYKFKFFVSFFSHFIFHILCCFFRSFHRVNLIWKIECFRIRWISYKSWFTMQSENIRFSATWKSFTINIMWAVVITMLSNSSNQNLLEISHLNYGRSLVAVSRIEKHDGKLTSHLPQSLSCDLYVNATDQRTCA